MMKSFSRKRNYRRYRFDGSNVRRFIENPSQTTSIAQSEVVLDMGRCPSHLPGWRHYFPTTEYETSGHIDRLVESFKGYFANHTFPSSLNEILERCSVRVDLETLINADIDFELDGFANVQEALHADPVRMRNIMGLAVHQLVFEMEQRRVSELMRCDNRAGGTEVQPPPMIQVELFNWPMAHTRIRDIKAQCLGRLVSIRGTVSSVSSLRPMCVQLGFQCSKCSTQFAIIQPKRAKQIAQPTRCVQARCGGRSFSTLYDCALTRLMDFQVIKVQAQQDELDDLGEDRIPRSIEVELTGSLVDVCGPGDVIIVCGVVKIKQENDQQAQGHLTHGTRESFTLCIEPFSVEQRDRYGGYGCVNNMSQLSVRELCGIRKLHGEGENLFNLLVASICPNIFGYDVVKAGVLLSMFSCRQTNSDRERNLSLSAPRSNIHCLLVGDPGTGKSQILKACASLAPRSIYTCGHTSTTAGLTVSIGRRSTNQGGDFAIQSGALVMADGGICCIDELDKIAHASLLEAMEQQFVSVAKAGVVCSVPSRCSVIAAANPSCGHYDRSRKLLDNVKLKAALLSRFDLVFLMVDEPDASHDNRLSRFLIDKHETSLCSRSSENEQSDDCLGFGSQVTRNEIVPASMIRKYIAYSLRYAREPYLTPDASEILKRFYLDARRDHDIGVIPITLRFLESLIRLCKARARLYLREQCTAEDANDAVRIVKYCVDQLNGSGPEALDPSVCYAKRKGSSKTKARARFLRMLGVFTERRRNDHLSWEELKEISEDANMECEDFQTFVAALNECGTLIKRGHNLFQFIDCSGI